MPRVAPEPALDNLATILNLALETQKLPVADRLEAETDQPDYYSSDIEGTEPALYFSIVTFTTLG